MLNRDDTGREIVYYPETGKRYFVEWIEPRSYKTYWGDIDPATKKVQGSYGSKSRGGIKEDESLITKENGFEEIIVGKGSPYAQIDYMHDKWKAENGY